MFAYVQICKVDLLLAGSLQGIRSASRNTYIWAKWEFQCLVEYLQRWGNYFCKKVKFYTGVELNLFAARKIEDPNLQSPGNNFFSRKFAQKTGQNAHVRELFPGSTPPKMSFPGVSRFGPKETSLQSFDLPLWTMWANSWTGPFWTFEARLPSWIPACSSDNRHYHCSAMMTRLLVTQCVEIVFLFCFVLQILLQHSWFLNSVKFRPSAKVQLAAAISDWLGLCTWEPLPHRLPLALHVQLTMQSLSCLLWRPFCKSMRPARCLTPMCAKHTDFTKGRLHGRFKKIKSVGVEPTLVTKIPTAELRA